MEINIDWDEAVDLYSIRLDGVVVLECLTQTEVERLTIKDIVELLY